MYFNRIYSPHIYDIAVSPTTHEIFGTEMTRNQLARDYANSQGRQKLVTCQKFPIYHPIILEGRRGGKYLRRYVVSIFY